MDPGSPAVRSLAAALLACAGLAACATPKHPIDLATSAPAPSRTQPSMTAPDGKPLRGTMKPYQIKGVWYTPAEQPDYDETGVASWYGEKFHNRQTANGEVFDQWRLSAAHKTLPLPSIVEVENLDNGRRMRLRVNDRGPFVEGRVIDLSRAAAEELGFVGKGVARVRVRYIGPAGPAGRDVGYRMAAAEPPAPKPAPGPAPPPAAPAGLWRVQAGTFADRGNAERLVRQLSAAGPASIEEVDVHGARLYRVVVGACADEGEAWSLRERVAVVVPDARVLRPS